MISSALASEDGNFFDQLKAHGESLAHRRAQTLAQSLRNAEHRWRSAAVLWPDLGLE